MIRWRPGALAALLGHAQYLFGEGGPALADRFLSAADDTASLLARAPRLGHPARMRHHSVKALRYGYVDGFPNHAMFFRPIRGGIEIVDIVHAARDLDAYFGGRAE